MITKRGHQEQPGQLGRLVPVISRHYHWNVVDGGGDRREQVAGAGDGAVRHEARTPLDQIDALSSQIAILTARIEQHVAGQASADRPGTLGRGQR